MSPPIGLAYLRNATTTRRAAGILDLPELAVFIFAFLLNLVWEFLQVPLYEGMAETAHWQGI
ncbi:MAG: hypothetical protein ACK56C_04430, partial [Alphaproteobacteria bacterium]